VGFDVTSYHCLVPSFGEWGFHIATVGHWREPSAFPPGLRFLDKPTLDQMLVFPVDMARVPSPVNRLNHQELVRLFEQEWSTVAN
jgi:spermidine synthase